ncbi:MAG: hypothetical protein SPI06_15925 [Terrisporobacter sp.]|uniref:hypothetical protein n=1 Tax=Terrisporobacter sp. TaxID=1965305 RepID=UPI002A92034F|nr:hypothetical protein [Terrisporobacter sp.]MDY6154887.1 hypothetical protein [Terrisporobacter sp.]
MAISKLSTSASLKQVMDKFEEISIQDFSKSNIDIITAKTLPSVVKEGQIVIITQNTPNKIYVSFDTKEISLSNNDILLQVSNKTTNKRPLYCGNKEISLVYSSCVQNGKPLKSYYGKNGQWIQITFTETYIFENGTTKIGNFKVTGGDNQATLITGGSLNLKVNAMYGISYCYVANTQLLDLSKYTKLYVRISDLFLGAKSGTQLDSNNYIDFGIASGTNGSFPDYFVNQTYFNTTTSRSYSNLLIELDISNINSGYFMLRGGHQGTGTLYNGICITNIYMS